MMAALRSPSRSRASATSISSRRSRPGQVAGDLAGSRCCAAARWSPARPPAVHGDALEEARRARADARWNARSKKSGGLLAQLVAHELEEEPVQLVEALDLAAHGGPAHALGVGLRLLARRLSADCVLRHPVQDARRPQPQTVRQTTKSAWRAAAQISSRLVTPSRVATSVQLVLVGGSVTPMMAAESASQRVALVEAAHRRRGCGSSARRRRMPSMSRSPVDMRSTITSREGRSPS